MGEIIVFNKPDAYSLLSRGFRYTERVTGNKKVFVFMQTPEIMKELSSKFEKGSFFVSKYACF